MKLIEFGTPFLKNEIFEIIFQEYRNDPIFPLQADNVHELEDDDARMIDSHVNEIYKFALQNGIMDAAEAVQEYREKVTKPGLRQKGWLKDFH